MTNIGWTPLFTRISAIVTDVGANLSHASIVARELGIPAVVGCGTATTRIRTGDRSRVDGGRGTVDVLEPASTAPESACPLTRRLLRRRADAPTPRPTRTNG
ncbi:PEP-utilizing enzyme [Streptomyces sp. E-08]|uniref:PEP-utilizing enzyme n=1 Tax=Streptomyces sp. E-08 TaxID=3404047 RepID=UPI003CE942D2